MESEKKTKIDFKSRKKEISDYCTAEFKGGEATKTGNNT